MLTTVYVVVMHVKLTLPLKLSCLFTDCFQSLINLTRATTLVILLRYLVQPQVIYATYNNIIAGHEYELCLPGDFSAV